MTEVDTVMHEGGAPVPGSPNNQTNNTSAFVNSSLNDDGEAKHDDIVGVASNNGTSNESLKNKITTEATASKTFNNKTATNVQTISSSISSSNNNSHDQQSDDKIESMDVDNCTGDIDGGGGGDVSTTTMEPECEEDSQVTSSSTDIEGGSKNQDSLKPTTSRSIASADEENSNSNCQQIDEGDDHNDEDNDNEKKSKEKKVIEVVKKLKETSKSTVGESSQSCDSFNNESQPSATVSEIKKQKYNDTEENSVDLEELKPKNSKESGDSLKNVQNENSSSSTIKPSGVKKVGDDDVEQIHEPMSVDDNDDDDDEDEEENDNGSHDEHENEADPLGGASNDATIGKNGLNSDDAAEKASTTTTTTTDNNNGAIVDLDDTDDEEDESNSGNGEVKKSKSNGNNKNVKSSTKEESPSKPHSVCSDSDDAVLIGSDSENENEMPPAKKSNTNTAPSTTSSTQIIDDDDDDDDDDCVVIEDDSPPKESISTNNNDQAKRKSMALEPDQNSDDSQPPSKRQRNTISSGGNSTAIPQLTIKDARSLTASSTTGITPSTTTDLSGSNVRKGMGNETTIYPVNITPAGSSTPVNVNTLIGPPKLAPLGGGSGSAISAVALTGGLTNLNSNANLLPGLTDDMFVLEAPSFIVPYIYEKPPGSNLKEIVKEIEAKYELTKEDLTEADKSDEFDMMTEQNKIERDQNKEQGGKKKKKRRGGDDADDSWSEESEDEDDDEDDDDSDSNVRTKVLIKEATDDLTALKGAIKPASAVLQSVGSGSTNAAGGGAGLTKPGQENYFESPLGKFFMDIGVGLVQEFVQSDLIRLQKRKMRKSFGQNTNDFERAIAALSGNLEASKKRNGPFKFTMKRCEFCNFKSESVLSMAHHYETPHMNGPLYKCNFCTFEIRNATEIVYHMEAMHNIKARLIKPLPYHQCPNCGFEDNGKAKLARHQPVCAKKFRPDLNLAPPSDWEAPAKIPRIKPRHGLVGTATAYQAMAAQAAAQKAALATIQQQQQQAQARNIQAAALAAQNAAKIRSRAPIIGKTGTGIAGNPNGTSVLRGGQSSMGPRAMATNVVLPNNYQMPGNQLLQANTLAGKKTSLPGQPSISITPLPRQGSSPQTSSPSTSKMPPAGMKPGKTPSGGSNKAQFVICEICDGYIKDLEQLRNHMQWMHEVKIHPKMIYNRPPLNCQKCQFRFFTDQGLERHLLGSHGLVTSSMQEAANKGKDAGRCPVCGRMYQWKLLNHVARDHHMTLKPAHLSYKCTVCTATFGMYKQFETHVYTAHSTVAKKAMDSKKNNATASGAAASTGVNANAAGSSPSTVNSGNQRAAANDALLKPLKINDEITIIPQPASKPRITNMESHVID